MSFSCPLCHARLTRSEKSFTCPQGHQFDMAKEGYVNLLPVQHKRSRDPGDSAEMMQARRAFLEAGHYEPLRDTLLQVLRFWISAVVRGTTRRCLQMWLVRRALKPTVWMFLKWLSARRRSAIRR